MRLLTSTAKAGCIQSLTRKTSRRLTWLLACVVIMTTVGCEPPPRPPIVKKKPKNDPLLQLPEEPEFSPVEATNSELPLRFATEAPFDLWEAYFLGGEQIGYNHLQAELTDKSDEVRYRSTERIQVLRGDQLLDSELTQISVENIYGRLKQFNAELLQNSQRSVAEGAARGNKLELIVRKAGEEAVNRELPWKPTTGGLVAVQQHLREKPMVRGDKRELSMLAPVTYSPSKILLEAIGMASVSMLKGENQMLLEIEATTVTDNVEGAKTTLWTDEQGNILKQFIPSLGLIILRTNEETATEFFEPQNDILKRFSITLDKPMEAPERTIRALYQVTSKSGRELAEVLKDQPGQLVRKITTGELQVAALGNSDADISPLAPGDGDRRPGPLVQSNDALIKQLAAVVKPDTKAEMAKKLAKLVYAHIDQKDNSEGFASAAFVASTGRGDCTEHAVLLTAMCRAKGIPARVAAGLVYRETDEGPAMQYHMWTLAYADDTWIQLDAMHPSGLAFADRITFTTNDLSAGNEFAVVQEVAALLGDLQIELGNVVQEDPQPDSAPVTNPIIEEENAPNKPENAADTLEDLLKGIDVGSGN